MNSPTGDDRRRTVLATLTVAALLLLACLGCSSPAPATTQSTTSALPSSVTSLPVATTASTLPATTSTTVTTLPTATTLPVPPTHIVYAVGDDTYPGSEEVARRLAGLIPLPSQGLELFAYLGDVRESGSVADFRRYDSIWGGGGHDLRLKTASILGNHELATRDVGWVPYWSGRLLPPWLGSLTQTDPPYYTVQMGDWKFIMLDTNQSVLAGSPQYGFLLAELQEKGRRTIVCGHNPRWSNGEHGDDPALDDAWKAMVDYGVVAYLAAHDHGSQIQPPRDRTGQAVSEGGVVQLVAAAGGAPLYGSVSGPGHAPAEWKDDTHFCILRLTLDTTFFQADFISADGDELHSQRFILGATP